MCQCILMLQIPAMEASTASHQRPLEQWGPTGIGNNQDKTTVWLASEAAGEK